MSNQKVFCNTPWYEAHIYWDGSLGICCQESRKLHTDNQKFNIKNISLTDWFNSEPVRYFRKSLLDNTRTDICSRCYDEELSKDMERDNFMSAQEAVDYGLADEIITKR